MVVKVVVDADCKRLRRLGSRAGPRTGKEERGFLQKKGGRVRSWGPRRFKGSRVFEVQAVLGGGGGVLVRFEALLCVPLRHKLLGGRGSGEGLLVPLLGRKPRSMAPMVALGLVPGLRTQVSK